MTHASCAICQFIHRILKSVNVCVTDQAPSLIVRRPMCPALSCHKSFDCLLMRRKPCGGLSRAVHHFRLSGNLRSVGAIVPHASKSFGIHTCTTHYKCDTHSICHFLYVHSPPHPPPLHPPLHWKWSCLLGIEVCPCLTLQPDSAAKLVL